jgi:small subunit ribosomal protein S17
MQAKIIKIIDDKTIKVQVTFLKKHKQYGKYISQNKNYIVDSQNSKVNIGDEVKIVSSRPISKLKKWKIK